MASSSSSSSSSSYNAPCAACKFLRRKCMSGCMFAPYFPPEEPQKFANVHKIFGASNVTKLLNDLLPHQREDAVNSLAYEAEARIRDPVYGCVASISYLQRQVHRLHKELEAANAQLLRYASHHDIIIHPSSSSPTSSLQGLPSIPTPQSQPNNFHDNHHSGNLYGISQFSSYDPSSRGGDGGNLPMLPYSLLPWSGDNVDYQRGGLGKDHD